METRAKEATGAALSSMRIGIRPAASAFLCRRKDERVRLASWLRCATNTGQDRCSRPCPVPREASLSGQVQQQLLRVLRQLFETREEGSGKRSINQAVVK